MTLETAIRQYLRQLQADGRSELTIDVYRRELRRFAAWRGAKTDIRRITPATVARYFTDPSRLVTAEGRVKSKRTVNRAKTAVRMLFGYVEAAGTIRNSPARLIRNARTDRPIAAVMSEDEQCRFLAALDDRAVDRASRRDRVLFQLLLKSGTRLTAALNVDVDDLDLDSCSLITEGKHARIQRVEFPADVARTIRDHLSAEEIHTGAIFIGRSSRLTSRQAQYRFKQVVSAAAIDRDVTVHSLRRSFARTVMEDSGDIGVVQGVLGHRRASTTLSYVI